MRAHECVLDTPLRARLGALLVPDDVDGHVRARERSVRALRERLEELLLADRLLRGPFHEGRERQVPGLGFRV